MLLPEGLACVAEVSSGAVHTCVLSAEGRLFGCGYNGHGQLGHGLVPTSVAAGPKQWALAPMPLPGALQTVRSVTPLPRYPMISHDLPRSPTISHDLP